MASSHKKRKTKARSKGETKAQTTSAKPVTTPPPTFYPPEKYQQITKQIAPQPPAIPDQLRDQLTGLMQELLLKTHELSFEYSTSECEEIRDCPLAIQAKELFKTVKKLHKLVRQVSPRGQTSYVT